MKSSVNVKKMWITWEIQPRNRSMATILDVELKELVINKSRWVKYPLLIIYTFVLLIKNRPKILFVQNPSIVLASTALLFKKILAFKLVVDAHNAGIYPLEGRYKSLNFLSKMISRYSDMVIVTNEVLAAQVCAWGGTPFVMPDPLPEYTLKKGQINNQSKVFFLICTWAEDEPYLEIIKAVGMLTSDVTLKITGNFRKKLSQEIIDSLPGNIKLLGFVTEETYVEELSAADFSIDLTTRENCLVCGAYESIAIGTPGILSDSLVNREIFPKGFVFTENHTSAIVNAFQEAIDRSEILKQDIVEMKYLHAQRIDRHKNDLISKLFK